MGVAEREMHMLSAGMEMKGTQKESYLVFKLCIPHICGPHAGFKVGGGFPTLTVHVTWVH